MNLNVKLDGEEDQGVQYVNRFAINIPSTAFNLNIVNPGLNNQSYILNPVNPVGQNIVTYQSPMAVQSYIALPTEPEGNLLHSLPVGVPVPVGLPVSTGFIQNHNFVNAGIIMGNEDCNSTTTTRILNNEGSSVMNSNEKLTYSPNLSEESINMEKIICGSPNTVSECVIKKPCPLEMSIKAANIDVEEFDKCDHQDIPVLIENSSACFSETKVFECNSLEKNSKDESVKCSANNLNVLTDSQMNDSKKVKTEITWENNNVKEVTCNHFQESLICEVEEVNEEDDYNEEDQEKIDYEKNHWQISGRKKKVLTQTKTNSGSESFSSEENDALPLSVSLNLKKSQLSKQKIKDKRISRSRLNKRRKCNIKKDDDQLIEKDIKTTEDEDDQESERSEREIEEQWSESDDDVLNLKRTKKSNMLKYEDDQPRDFKLACSKDGERSVKFVRVRSCCSKKECSKNISVKDQIAAHNFYYDLESNFKRDSYLINCIEHVQKNGRVEKDKSCCHSVKEEELKKNIEAANIQMEIENESKGNQKLSDEIQMAINESLKDFMVSEDEESKSKEENEVNIKENSDKEEKKNWNYYVVVDRCRKKVCLQFLLKLLRVPKTRIKQLQKKILSGSALADEVNTQRMENVDSWSSTAKIHLKSVEFSNLKQNILNPLSSRTAEDLFLSFKDFYYEQHGKELDLKYPTYKRFLETSLSLTPQAHVPCTKLEDSKWKKKEKKNFKERGKISKYNHLKEKSTKRAIDPRSRLSDENCLTNRKKLRLKINLKNIKDGNKSVDVEQKKNKKRNVVKDKKNKGNKASLSKGRDVWSLMLLHLETMPYKECLGCTNKKKHRFLDSSFTTQGLFEDYRKYFLKETNSELGLGFTMYEKYFNKNCNYTILDLNLEGTCPLCEGSIS